MEVNKLYIPLNVYLDHVEEAVVDDVGPQTDRVPVFCIIDITQGTILVFIQQKPMRISLSIPPQKKKIFPNVHIAEDDVGPLSVEVDAPIICRILISIPGSFQDSSQSLSRANFIETIEGV